MKIEVKWMANNGKWGLFVNGRLLAESKHRYDADYGYIVLLTALGEAALDGF